MKKKKIIIISIILLSCLVVFSSFILKKDEAEPITLTVWHYYGGTANETFSYLVQNFNQTVGLEQNIIVEAYSFNGVSELAQAVNASANGMSGASPMPSIFASYIDSIVSLEADGLIANLGRYFTTEELNTYYSPFISEGRLGDKDELRILPIAKSTEVLHINKTIFDKFASETGYSYDYLETWEGLAEVSSAYYDWTDAQTSTKTDGKAFFGTDGMANFMIVGTKQLGNDIFTQNGDEIYHNFTEEIAQKIWEVFYIPYIQGHFSADAYYRSDDVASGEIVAYVGSTASSYYFPSQMLTDSGEYVSIECKTMEYPVFEDGKDVVVSQGAGMVVSSSTTEIEQAATVFLKWFTESDNNCGFAVSTGYMPVKNDVLNSEYIINEMSRDGSVDESLPIVQATHTTYQQLLDYDFYTSIPFEGSDDARTILEYSLVEKIELDKLSLENRVNNGEIFDEVLEELTSEENFNAWYTDISTKLNDAINP